MLITQPKASFRYDPTRGLNGVVHSPTPRSDSEQHSQFRVRRHRDAHRLSIRLIHAHRNLFSLMIRQFHCGWLL